MKDVLVLFDGTRIELEDYSSINNLMHFMDFKMAEKQGAIT